jgi:hypothetical protein
MHRHVSGDRPEHAWPAGAAESDGGRRTRIQMRQKRALRLTK